eukprot:tig00020830_g14441.t1
MAPSRGERRALWALAILAALAVAHGGALFGVATIDGQNRWVLVNPATGDLMPLIGLPALQSQILGTSTFSPPVNELSTFQTDTQDFFLSQVSTFQTLREGTVNISGIPNFAVSSFEFAADGSTLFGVVNNQNLISAVRLNPLTGSMDFIFNFTSNYTDVYPGISALDAAGNRYFCLLLGADLQTRLVVVNVVSGAVSSSPFGKPLTALKYDPVNARLVGQIIQGSYSTLDVRVADVPRGSHSLVVIDPASGAITSELAAVPDPYSQLFLAGYDAGKQLFYTNTLPAPEAQPVVKGYATAPGGTAREELPLTTTDSSRLQFLFALDKNFWEAVHPRSGPASGATLFRVISNQLPILTGTDFSIWVRFNFTNGYREVPGNFDSLSQSRAVVCLSPDVRDLFVSEQFITANISVSFLGQNGSYIPAYGLPFLFYQTPVIVTNISVMTGPRAGGNNITVTGINFLETEEILCGFGGNMSAFYGANLTSPGVFVAPNKIVCQSPYSNYTGLVPFGIALNGQQYHSYEDFWFLFYDFPVYTTSILPKSGPVTGGTIVQVSGVGIVETNDTFCKFVVPAPYPATIVVKGYYNASNNGTVRCVSPVIDLRFDGNAQIFLSLDGQRYNNSQTFRYYPAPTIVTSILPVSGPISGSTIVTVFGRNFRNTGEETCAFEPWYWVPATYVANPGGDPYYTCRTPTPLDLVLPQVQPLSGPANFSFSLNRQQFSADVKRFLFYPYDVNVVSVSPTEGYASGLLLNGISSTITIFGRGFVNTGEITAQFQPVTPQGPLVTVAGGPALFESTATANCTYVSNTTLLVNLPRKLFAGLVYVEVGLNSFQYTTDRVGFTYYPYISNITPQSGLTLNPNEVSVEGIGFTNTTRCRWNPTTNRTGFYHNETIERTVGELEPGAPRANYWLSATNIICYTPLYIDYGWGNLSVTVDRFNYSNIAPFRYFKPPVFGTIDPVLGPLSGGTPVTIRGEVFVDTGEIVCVWGALRTPATFVNDQEIICPSADYRSVSPLTPVAVVMRFSLNGVLFPPNNMSYYYYPNPVLTAITPSAAADIARTQLVIYGQYLWDPRVVMVNTLVNPQNKPVLSSAEPYKTQINVTCRFFDTSTLREYRVIGTADTETVRCTTPDFVLSRSPEFIVFNVTYNDRTDANDLSLSTRFFPRLRVYKLPISQSRLAPSVGLTTGVTTVTIQGSGFVDTNEYNDINNPDMITQYNIKIRYQFVGPEGTKVVNGTWDPATGYIVHTAPRLNRLEQQPVAKVDLSLDGQLFTEFFGNVLLFQYIDSRFVASLNRTLPTTGPIYGRTVLRVFGKYFVTGTLVRPWARCRLVLWGSDPPRQVAKWPATVINSGLIQCSTPATSACTPASFCDLPDGMSLKLGFQVSLNDQQWTESQTYTPFTYYLDKQFIGTPFPTSVAVIRLTPRSGPLTGNTTVIVDGQNFFNTGEIRVAFGFLGRLRATYVNRTRLIVTSPVARLPAPTVNVEVGLNGQQYSRSFKRFAYYVTPVNVQQLVLPTGLIAGGETVTVFGRNLRDPVCRGSDIDKCPDGETLCRFGRASVRARETIVGLNRTLTCVAPAAPYGDVPLEVALNGQQFTADNVQYNYYDLHSLPIVTALRPYAGPIQGFAVKVTIIGENFGRNPAARCRVQQGPVIRYVPAVFLSGRNVTCTFTSDILAFYAIGPAIIEYSNNGTDFSRGGRIFTFTALYPPNCYANGPGMVTAVAGQVASMTVFAMDNQNPTQQLSSGGDDFAVYLYHPFIDNVFDIDENALYDWFIEPEPYDPFDPDPFGKPLVNASRVEDQGDGSYNAMYMSEMAGTFTLRIRGAGIDIGQGDTGSPYKIPLIILPAETHVPNCVILNLNESIVAGTPVSVTLQTRDRFHNDRPALTLAEEPIQATLEGPGVVPVSVSVRGAGTAARYYGDFTLTKAGVYTLSATLRGEQFAGSPATFTVEPGPTYPPNSFAEPVVSFGNIGTRSVTAGDQIVVNIQAVDFYGNARKSTGDVVEVTFTPPLAIYTVADLNDGSTGQYVLQYQINKTGNYQMAILLNGQHIKESPFTVEVRPGLTTAAACITVGSGTNLAIAGELTTFTIIAYDAYGNLRLRGGDQFILEIYNTPTDLRPIEALALGERPGVLQTYETQPLDDGSGNYTARYQIVLSQYYYVKVLLNETRRILDEDGQRITVTSPVAIPGNYAADNKFFDLWVDAAATSDLVSLAYGSTGRVGKGTCQEYLRNGRQGVPDALFKGISGIRMTFCLQSRDRFGNKRTKGGDDWFVNGSLATRPLKPGKLRNLGEMNTVVTYLGADATRIDRNMGGLYRIDYLAIPAGCNYTMTIRLRPSVGGNYLGYPLVPESENTTYIYNKIFTIVVDIAPQPRISNAIISDIGDIITLTFDMDTNRGGLVGIFKCRTVFVEVRQLGIDATIEKLPTSSCLWQNDNTLVVTLGFVEFPPSESNETRYLYLNPTAQILNYYETSDAAAGNATILPPINPVTPIANIAGSAIIGGCLPETLDAGNSNNTGPYKVTYSWSIVTTEVPARDAAKKDKLEKLVADVNKADVESGIQGVRLSKGNRYLRLSNEELDPGYYEVILVVTNAFGKRSAEARLSLYKTDTALPKVSIAFEKVYEVTRARELLVRANAELPDPAKCPTAKNDDILFEWSGDDDAGRDFITEFRNVKVFGLEKSVMRIEPRALQVWGTYKFRVTCRIKGAVEQDKVSDSVTLNVVPSPINVIIGNGGRPIAQTKAFVLDAGQSVDPDDEPGELSYEWECLYFLPFQTVPDQPCMTTNGSLLVVAPSRAAVFPAGHLREGKYRFFVTVSKGARSNRDYSDVEIVKVPPLQVSIQRIAIPKVPPNTQFKLDGKIDDDQSGLGVPRSQVNWYWSVERGDLNLTSVGVVASDEPSVVFDGRWGGRGNQYSRLLLSPDVLVPGQEYTIRASVEYYEKSLDATRTGYAQVQFLVSRPPSGGQFNVQPVVVGAQTEGKDEFTTLISGWQTVDPPLEYQLFLVTGNSSNPSEARPEKALKLTDKVSRTTFTFKIPQSGFVMLLCEISDVYGAATVARAQIRVDPQTPAVSKETVANPSSSMSNAVFTSNSNSASQGASSVITQTKQQIKTNRKVQSLRRGLRQSSVEGLALETAAAAVNAYKTVIDTLLVVFRRVEASPSLVSMLLQVVKSCSEGLAEIMKASAANALADGRALADADFKKAQAAAGAGFDFTVELFRAAANYSFLIETQQKTALVPIAQLALDFASDIMTVRLAGATESFTLGLPPSLPLGGGSGGSFGQSAARYSARYIGPYNRRRMLQLQGGGGGSNGTLQAYTPPASTLERSDSDRMLALMEEVCRPVIGTDGCGQRASDFSYPLLRVVCFRDCPESYGFAQSSQAGQRVLSPEFGNTLKNVTYSVRLATGGAAAAPVQVSFTIHPSILQQLQSRLGSEYLDVRVAYWPQQASLRGYAPSTRGSLFAADTISIQLTSGADIEPSSLSRPFTLLIPITNNPVFQNDSVQPVCQYFDPAGQAWSSRGCVLGDISGGYATCYCNHLSEFSLVMAPSVPVVQAPRARPSVAQMLTVMYPSSWHPIAVLAITLGIFVVSTVAGYTADEVSLYKWRARRALHDPYIFRRPGESTWIAVVPAPAREGGGTDQVKSLIAGPRVLKADARGIVVGMPRRAALAAMATGKVKPGGKHVPLSAKASLPAVLVEAKGQSLLGKAFRRVWRDQRRSHPLLTLFTVTPGDPFTRPQRLTCLLCLVMGLMALDAVFFGTDVRATWEGPARDKFYFTGMVTAAVMAPAYALFVAIFRFSHAMIVKFSRGETTASIERWISLRDIQSGRLPRGYSDKEMDLLVSRVQSYFRGYAQRKRDRVNRAIEASYQLKPRLARGASALAGSLRGESVASIGMPVPPPIPGLRRGPVPPPGPAPPEAQLQGRKGPRPPAGAPPRRAPASPRPRTAPSAAAARRAPPGPRRRRPLAAAPPALAPGERSRPVGRRRIGSSGPGSADGSVAGSAQASPRDPAAPPPPPARPAAAAPRRPGRQRLRAAGAPPAAGPPPPGSAPPPPPARRAPPGPLLRRAALARGRRPGTGARGASTTPAAASGRHARRPHGAAPDVLRGIPPPRGGVLVPPASARPAGAGAEAYRVPHQVERMVTRVQAVYRGFITRKRLRVVNHLHAPGRYATALPPSVTDVPSRPRAELLKPHEYALRPRAEPTFIRAARKRDEAELEALYRTIRPLVLPTISHASVMLVAARQAAEAHRARNAKLAAEKGLQDGKAAPLHGRLVDGSFAAGAQSARKYSVVTPPTSVGNLRPVGGEKVEPADEKQILGLKGAIENTKRIGRFKSSVRHDEGDALMPPGNPWWFTLAAYGIAFCWAAATGYFTVVFGTALEEQVAWQWLEALGIAVAQALLVQEPLRVLLGTLVDKLATARAAKRAITATRPKTAAAAAKDGEEGEGGKSGKPLKKEAEAAAPEPEPGKLVQTPRRERRVIGALAAAQSAAERAAPRAPRPRPPRPRRAGVAPKPAPPSGPPPPAPTLTPPRPARPRSARRAGCQARAAAAPAGAPTAAFSPARAKRSAIAAAAPAAPETDFAPLDGEPAPAQPDDEPAAPEPAPEPAAAPVAAGAPPETRDGALTAYVSSYVEQAPPAVPSEDA